MDGYREELNVVVVSAHFLAAFTQFLLAGERIIKGIIGNEYGEYDGKDEDDTDYGIEYVPFDQIRTDPVAVWRSIRSFCNTFDGTDGNGGTARIEQDSAAGAPDDGKHSAQPREYILGLHRSGWTETVILSCRNLEEVTIYDEENDEAESESNKTEKKEKKKQAAKKEPEKKAAAGKEPPKKPTHKKEKSEKKAVAKVAKIATSEKKAVERKSGKNPSTKKVTKKE